MASSPVELSSLIRARAVRAVGVSVALCFSGCVAARRPLVATQVSPGILTGRQPRDQVDYEALKAQGVRTILSVQVLPWDVARGRRQAELFGITFRNLPIPAWVLKPSESLVKEALMTLRDRTLRPIYFHCKLGRDRAVLIVGLYRIYFEDWTPDAAWEEMLRSGFKVRWSLRGLRAYFWSHCEKPGWVHETGGESGSRRPAGESPLRTTNLAIPLLATSLDGGGLQVTWSDTADPMALLP